MEERINLRNFDYEDALVDNYYGNIEKVEALKQEISEIKN